MTQPLVDLQAIKQKFHLTDVRMPSDSERATIGREKFSSDPVAQKAIWPTRVDAAYIQDVQKNVDEFAALTSKSASIFFRRDGQGLTAKVGAVTFDLILSEEHELSATICSHPVQNGDAISDHIQTQLPAGRVQVLVSNYSLKDAPGGARESQALWNTSNNRASAAYDTFKAIFKAKQTVTLVTVLEQYDNVAITHVSAPRDAGTGDALIFDVSFQQIKTVQLKVMKLDGIVKPADMKSDKNRQASPKFSGGTVTPDEVPLNTASNIGG